MKNSRILTIASFSFFVAWLLSFAYEGQIFYALADWYKIDSGTMVLGAILLHAAGLFSCGFAAKNMQTAKNLMIVATIVCITGSSVFFFRPSGMWAAALLTISFFAGWWNAAWAWFYRDCSAKNQRMGTVAAAIAASTTIMIGLNLSAIYLSPFIGLALSVLCLIVSLVFTIQLPKLTSNGFQSNTEKNLRQKTNAQSTKERWPAIAQPLALLCVFIVIVTINSGLMFQVVNPAFAHLTWLTSWYWAVPYIAALVMVALLPRRINRIYILFGAIAMLGFAFIMFTALDRSAISYLVVNTLLMGACGINDLFWWSILGEMLDFHRNPARLFGIGLSVNVGGVLLGEWISGLVSGPEGEIVPSLVGLAVVCVALVILPLLYRQLTLLLRGSTFFTSLKEMPEEERNRTVDSLMQAGGLTSREQDVAALLFRGYTYRMIAQELYLSETTVKTHIQKIYRKLEVKNKAEFIRKLAK